MIKMVINLIKVIVKENKQVKRLLVWQISKYDTVMLTET